MTTVANNGQFGPNYFLVQTLAERNSKSPPTVAAQFLTDSAGDYVIDPTTSKPYVVPQGYDPYAVIQKFQQ